MSPGPRLFDCFTFSTELDLLAFRLDLLAPVVDRFVIVEAPRTHSGIDKPLVFHENRDRFAAHLDRITHVVVDDLPAPVPDRWVPETFQRDAILRGLVDADPDDIALVTDADEIPDPEILRRLRGESFQTARLEMQACFYFANWQQTQPWSLARAARVGALGRPSELRTTTPVLSVPDAGSHFSYLMSPADIERKYSWFGHSELDQPLHRASSYLESMVALGIIAHTGDILAVQGPSELGPVQRRLLARDPGAFEFDAPPSVLRTVGAVWRRLRKRRGVPAPVVRRGDDALARLRDLAGRTHHG